jgi:predicted NACHT family NTPase
MPIDLLAIALELIAGEGLEIIKDKAKRNEAILSILNQIPPLRPDAPLDERFDGVYAYTLVHYATGTGKPKTLLEFFRHPFIKDAFWKSFVNQDASILDEETENFLEWNRIGKDILAMDFSPQREFAEFREHFILAAKLTRTVKEVLVDQTLEGISRGIQELPTKTDLAIEIAPLARNLKIYSKAVTKPLKESSSHENLLAEIKSNTKVAGLLIRIYIYRIF